MKLRAVENWLFGKMRHTHAANITERSIHPWNLAGWRRHKYCLLTTYRRDGTPVNTPVWFGIEAESLYVRSGSQDGKVKRIRREPRVLVSPCTARGRPLDDPMQGHARLLAPQESAGAEAALRAHYGLGRRLYKLARRGLEVAYIEIAPER